MYATPKEQYLSFNLVSLYEAISLHVSDKMENMEYGTFKRSCKWQYSELQFRWKIIFPFLAKSRAHMHTCTGVYGMRMGMRLCKEWENFPTQLQFTVSTADFSSIRIFCDCVKRSVASSMALCTTETIQMGSPQQLEST